MYYYKSNLNFYYKLNLEKLQANKVYKIVRKSGLFFAFKQEIKQDLSKIIEFA